MISAQNALALTLKEFYNHGNSLAPFLVVFWRRW